MDLLMLREYERLDAQQENEELEARFKKSSAAMGKMLMGQKKWQKT